MRKIIIAFTLSSLLGYLPTFFSTSSAWDVYAIANRLEVLIWLSVFFMFIPYRSLASKSVIAAAIVIEIINIINFLFYIYDHTLIGVFPAKVCLCICIMCYIVVRDYNIENDPLDEEHFFKVSRIPDSLQDFLLSLIKDPLGGTGVYAQNKFYHYSKGKLVVHDKEFLFRKKDKIKIIRMRSIDDERLNTLNSLINSRYSEWSLLLNCKTVLEPIIGDRGKPIFKKDK
jgi:hypothetical protein